MSSNITAALAAVALLLACGAGRADPLKCTDEARACLKTCVQLPGATLAACQTACRDRQKDCMRTGCWNTGVKNYCGLSKQ
jgi:hypothetical protein